MSARVLKPTENMTNLDRPTDEEIPYFARLKGSSKNFSKDVGLPNFMAPTFRSVINNLDGKKKQGPSLLSGKHKQLKLNEINKMEELLQQNDPFRQQVTDSILRSRSSSRESKY